MNCQECQDELTAYLEGLLDEPRQSQIDLHVAECVACQAELQAVRELTVRLARHGLAAPAISLETAVMDRILHDQALQLRRLKMRKRLRVLGFSGVTAAAIAIVFVSSLWFAQPAEAQKAVEVMAQGAKAVANPSAVHIMAKMRTLPYDNFSMIGAEYEFVPIEIWKQFNGKSAWRVEKPGRVIVMDGATTEMLIRPDRLVQLPMVTQGAFNSGWLLALTRVQDMVNHELRAAQKQGWDINLTHETTAAGAKQLVVTVEAKSGLPADDYLQNKSLEDADMRRVYRFNAETKRLEGFEAHLHHAGSDVLILAIESIEYDKKIDPTVFALQLPEKVTLIREPGPLPDNEKYQKMTPKEAATTFFEACGKEDWTEVEKFYSSVNQRLKDYLGGLTIVTLGEPFQSKGYGGWFIPYEIKLKDGSVRKHNVSVRNDNPAKRYVVDGGI